MTYYRSLNFEENFFTESCLSGITKLHITVYFLNDLYLPMALAIIQKENECRKTKNIESLEVIFYMFHNVRKLLQDNLSDYDKNVKLKTWDRHPINDDSKSNDKHNVYITLIEEGDFCLDHDDARGIPRQDFFYWHPLAPLPECLEITRLKLLLTPDEFYNQLNIDMCIK